MVEFSGDDYKSMDQISLDNPWLIVVLILWVLPWKGYALWVAARINSKVWFVSLFIVNTMGLLDILYIYVFSNKKVGK